MLLPLASFLAYHLCKLDPASERTGYAAPITLSILPWLAWPVGSPGSLGNAQDSVDLLDT